MKQDCHEVLIVGADSYWVHYIIVSCIFETFYNENTGKYRISKERKKVIMRSRANYIYSHRVKNTSKGG